MSRAREDQSNDRGLSKGRAVSAALLAAFTLTGPVRADGDAPAGFEPLAEKKLGDGDVELRIHYLGNQFRVSRWWILRRTGGTTEASSLAETPQYVPPTTRKLTSRLVSSKLWSGLENLGFLDLPGNTDVALCTDPIPADSDILLIEVVRGDRYREFSYYEPAASSCGRADEFRSGLDFLKKLLGDSYAIP
jgi:hypothetical protein